MTDTRPTEWFDDAEFWEKLYPYMFEERRMEGVADVVERLLTLTEPQGKSVLDLCCGPARFATELAKVGYEVTGVDKTKFLLEKARERAVAESVEIELVESDMRDFKRTESFDLIINMFTSFGYFDEKNEDLLVLRNIYDSLRQGGKVVIETMGKEVLARIFHGTTSTVYPDGATLIQRHELFDDWTRVRNEWILVKGNGAQTFTFHHTVYSGQELREKMNSVGFDTVNVYGNLSGSPYDNRAERLIAVGTKQR